MRMRVAVCLQMQTNGLVKYVEVFPHLLGAPARQPVPKQPVMMLTAALPPVEVRGVVAFEVEVGTRWGPHPHVGWQ